MVPAIEIMLCNPAIRNIIREARTFEIPNVIETNRQIGMISLDTAIAEFIQKVDISIDDTNSGKFAPARVTVKTSSGAKLEADLENVPGTIANPLSDDQVAAKFRDCAQFGMQPRRTAEADALAASLGRLEDRDSLTGILDRS